MAKDRQVYTPEQVARIVKETLRRYKQVQRYNREGGCGDETIDSRSMVTVRNRIQSGYEGSVPQNVRAEIGIDNVFDL